MDRHVVRAICRGPIRTTLGGTSDGVLELSSIDARRVPDPAPSAARPAVFGIYQDRAGTIWIAARGGLTRVSGDRVTTFGSARRVSGGRRHVDLRGSGRQSLDRHNGNGLVRLRGEQFDTLTVRDGLSNGFVSALYEDREGSLWIGSNDGLNRLRDTRFTTITTREGLSADAVVSHRRRPRWNGVDWNRRRRVEPSVWRQDYHATRPQAVCRATTCGALFEAADGAVWITGDGVVTRLRDGRIRVYTAADGVPGGLRLGDCRRSAWPTPHLRRRSATRAERRPIRGLPRGSRAHIEYATR